MTHDWTKICHLQQPAGLLPYLADWNARQKWTSQRPRHAYFTQSTGSVSNEVKQHFTKCS